MLISASIVAFTTLCGLLEPLLLASTSVTPTLSSTARIAPPAITPVPCAAGFSSTLAPANLPSCRWGMVPLRTAHLHQVLLGVVDAFGDGLLHLLGLAQAVAHHTVLVAHHHDGGEGEGASALGHLGHAVQGHELVLQLEVAAAHFLVVRSRSWCDDQN